MSTTQQTTGGFERSRQQIEAASAVLPGGVNSNFRLGMAPTPLVFERGEGAFLHDVDGNRLIDYYLGMGPMILGHSPRELREAVAAQMERGILFAGQSQAEFDAARLLCRMVPCAERVRFSASGSEAVQAALRLSRAATGRAVVVKFEGHYHGWFDNILWSTAPPAGANAPVPGSLGQMESAAADGPAPGYLQAARAMCDRYGTVLIFDEVITGFRLGPGGAQARLGVTPHLAVFAKAIANGFPVSAVAGRADLLEWCTKGVVHGGTYNGQAVAMAACVATLERLSAPDAFAGMERCGTRLMEGLRQRFAAAGVGAVVAGFPQAFHVAFGLSEPARNWADLRRADRTRYVAFTAALLRHGVRALERGAWFLSTEHDDAVIDRTLDAVSAALREL